MNPDWWVGFGVGLIGGWAVALAFVIVAISNVRVGADGSVTR